MKKLHDERDREAKLRALHHIVKKHDARSDVPEFKGSPNENASPQDSLDAIYAHVLNKKGVDVAGKKKKREE